MLKELNVLSLFDGMGCLAVALKESNIKYNTYYSSEIDKFANQQTALNFPDHIQLGSVCDVDVSKLKTIGFLGGGSPCQSFSFAGKRKGMATKCEMEILSLEHYLELKSNGFEFEGQSYLFWEYMRILTDIQKYNPDVKFLLENVEMGEKWEKVLSKAIGVNGVHINSALVSAQNRKRIYWTNIGLEPGGLFGDLESIIEQPKDRKILLKDILQPVEEVDGKYYLSESAIKYLERAKFERTENVKYNNGNEKTSCLTANYKRGVHNGGETYVKLDKNLNPKNNQDKASCFTAGAHSGGNHSDMDLIAYGCDYRNDEGFRVRPEQKPSTLMARAREDVYGTGLVCHNMMPKSSTTGKGGTGHLKREDGKTYCLDTGSTNAIEIRQSIRRLTPAECCRLQTIPDWYKWKVSDSQIYKMCGNGWTVQIICHILSYLERQP